MRKVIPRSDLVFQLEDHRLTIIPHTRSAAIALNKLETQFDPEGDPEGFLSYIEVMPPVALRGSGWWRTETSTDFGEPVIEAVHRWTGPFPFEPLDITDCLESLCHTRIIDSAILHDNGRVVVTGYNSGYDRGEEYAKEGFARRICEELGDEECISEFIPVRGDGGLYKHNPDYARRRPKIFKRLPQYCNDKQQRIADLLWEIWMKTELPSLDQRAALRAGILNDRQWPTLRDYSLYYRSSADDAFDWDGKGAKAKILTPDQFRKLAIPTS